MFLTTNRIDDVDDAIVSRMIALFHYKRPDLEMSDRLWRILAQQFDIELTDKQAEALVIEFRGLPGRDIKQLLRLVKKYCARKNVGLSLKVFRICAMFRGIDNTKTDHARCGVKIL
jgi:AAA+ superfamily predicted ATPase